MVCRSGERVKSKPTRKEGVKVPGKEGEDKIWKKVGRKNKKHMKSRPTVSGENVIGPTNLSVGDQEKVEGISANPIIL